MAAVTDAHTARLSLSFPETPDGYIMQASLPVVGVIATCETPCAVGVGDGLGAPTWVKGPYTRVRKLAGGFVATGSVEWSGVRFAVQDRYRRRGDGFDARRCIRVQGDGSPSGGFLSCLEWTLARASYDDEWFVPGVWYGNNERVPPWAIGSPATRSKVSETLFREDRLSLPFLLHYERANDVAFVMAHLGGRPTTVEADDSEEPLVDERLQFGSFGARGAHGDVAVFQFPGTEGQVLYPPMWTIERGNQQADSPVNPFAVKDPRSRVSGWTRRMHPLRHGFEHRYTLSLWVERKGSYRAASGSAWRAVWREYPKRIRRAPLRRIENRSIDLLSRLVRERAEAAGIPTWIDCFTGEPGKLQNDFDIGFVGRNLEVAYVLVEASHRRHSAELRRKGRLIIDFWVRESGRGLCHTSYDYEHGEWKDQCSDDGRTFTYLRDQSELHRAVLHSWLSERWRGTDRRLWFSWAQSYAEWLLENANDSGSYYRACDFQGIPVSTSDAGSIHASAFLADLYAASEDDRYLALAERIAEYVWKTYHERGLYYGATLDNPDCVDKESSALAVDGYLRLFECTRNPKWLAAADAAARICETWIIGWEIPMPKDPSGPRFYSPKATTVGLQLITTGFSAVDMFLSRQVGDFYRLASYTGDRHYRRVAKILLHNSKCMIQQADEFGYRYSGMQIEHWAIGRGRGFGLNSGWLPWVSSGHVLGIWNRSARRSLQLLPENRQHRGA